MALLATVCASASAAVVNYDVQKPLSLYGHVDQRTIGEEGFGDVACGPTSAVNSFVYLANQYPAYGGGLIPNYDGDSVLGKDDPDDLARAIQELASDKYMNLGEDGVTDAGFVTGKRQWLKDFAPGKICQKGIDDEGAGGLTKGTPDWKFIFDELKRCEDVEVGFTWSGGGGHWVTATSLHFADENDNKLIDDGEQATLDFIDPWGGVELTGTLSVGEDGFLRLEYSGGAATTGGTGRIDIVVAESPVPEPASIAIWSGLILVGAGAAWRRRRGRPGV